MKRMLRIGTMVGFCLAWCALACADADPLKQQLQLLSQHGIETNTPGLLAFLERMQPNKKLQAEIATLIDQLSDTEFNTRESAFKKLPTFGEAARKQLADATKSKDPEVSWRAGKILKELDGENQSRRRESLVVASLEILKSRGEAKAALTILATIPLLTERHLFHTACQALWACVDAPHAELLNAAINHKDQQVRVAAIVGLEKSAGEDALPTIGPLLKSDQAIIRLAAARALIDQKPEDAIQVLVDLTGEVDEDIAWQADALLHLKTGQRVVPAEGKSLRDAWNQWAAAKLGSANLVAKLGDQRHDLTAGRNMHEESFTRNQESLAKGYGRFLYEADNGGKATVADGKLRIDGDNPEGDQRLYITSQRMLGRDRWPDKLEVRAKLAGEEGNNFGWHMGVSVGRVKVLFHPGLGGGAFRAETTDEHDYLFTNEDMSFEPVNDVFHEMTIRVTKTDAGADFEVTVNGGKGGAPHTKKFTANREQLGDYKRIGLERSGRTGADALFDSVSIRLGR